MLIEGQKVTVEANAFDNDAHKGKRATVIAISGCFAIIDIEDVGIRSCLTECLQPRVTAEQFSQ